MATNAAVSVEGLSGSTLTTGALAVTPAGASTTGAQIIQWQGEILSSTSSEPMDTAAGVLFATWYPAVALTPGRQYTARVRVQDETWQWSSWATRTFTFSPDTAALPPPPLLAVTEPAERGRVPFLSLNIVTPAGPWASQQFRWQVERSDEVYGWIKWTERWTGGNNQVSVFDYAVPSDWRGRYRVRPLITDTSGHEVVGPYTYSPAAALTYAKVGGWLVDPLNPELAVKLKVQSRGDRKHDTGATSVQLLGPDTDQLITGGAHHGQRLATNISFQVPSLPEASITAHVWTASEQERVVRMLTSGNLLLLRGHRNLKLRGGYSRERDWWFRVTGSVSESDVAKRAHELREVEFDTTGQHPLGVDGAA